MRRIRTDEHRDGGTLKVRAVTGADRPWMERFIVERWGAPIVVARGEVYRPHELPGFVADYGGRRAGLITYQIAGDQCEVVSIDSRQPGIGVGTALRRPDPGRDRAGTADLTNSPAALTPDPA